jgi:hypothetical protein
MASSKLATFKIQSDTWDSFTAQAAADGTNASALLKLFIDAYLAKRIDLTTLKAGEAIEGIQAVIDARIDERLFPIAQELGVLREKLPA